MEREDTAVSLIALAAALLLTLVLFFGNFAAAYLVQLLRGEGIPLARFTGVLLVEALALAALVWGGRWWWRTIGGPARAARGDPIPTPPPERTPAPARTVAPTPPPAGDGTTSDRWLLSEARRRLLTLAESPAGFTLDEALLATALEPNDLSYLIDELIGAHLLRAEASGRGFSYHLRHPAGDPRRDPV